MNLKIEKLLSPTESDLTQLNSEFWKFVTTKMPGLSHESEDKKFLFSVFDVSKFIGGISGNVYWNGLEIDTLWVDENYRGLGVGKRLLSEAEKYAIENEAIVSFLKTVDAQEFYRKFGYEVYGVLEDRPIGTDLYHMKKRIG